MVYLNIIEPHLEFVINILINYMGKNVKLKIILLGDTFSGKSSILNRYKNNVFEETPVATIGVDFMIRSFDL